MRRVLRDALGIAIALNRTLVLVGFATTPFYFPLRP
tara:strand:- start:24 stop:131 length:108 start_codon:yes stop_codon:yes gene_type:complete